MLKFSSYIFSIVPFANSKFSFFRFSLSLSLKNPSELILLGNTPSFTPIIKTAFTLWVFVLFTAPTITESWFEGICPISFDWSAVFKIFEYSSKFIFWFLKTFDISASASTIKFHASTFSSLFKKLLFVLLFKLLLKLLFKLLLKLLFELLFKLLLHLLFM